LTEEFDSPFLGANDSFDYSDYLSLEQIKKVTPTEKKNEK